LFDDPVLGEEIRGGFTVLSRVAGRGLAVRGRAGGFVDKSGAPGQAVRVAAA